MANPIGQLRGQSGHHDEGIGLGVPHVLLTSSFDDDVVRNSTLCKGSQVGLLSKLDEQGLIEWAVLVPRSWLVGESAAVLPKGWGSCPVMEIGSEATSRGLATFLGRRVVVG